MSYEVSTFVRKLCGLGLCRRLDRCSFGCLSMVCVFEFFMVVGVRGVLPSVAVLRVRTEAQIRIFLGLSFVEQSSLLSFILHALGGHFLVFFFQAEDGIRDHCVTGVQTCALPILARYRSASAVGSREFVEPSSVTIH